MKVIATKKGYFGKLRHAGEEFDVPEKSKASWFEPVEKPGKKQDDKKPAEESGELV